MYKVMIGVVLGLLALSPNSHAEVSAKASHALFKKAIASELVPAGGGQSIPEPPRPSVMPSATPSVTETPAPSEIPVVPSDCIQKSNNGFLGFYECNTARFICFVAVGATTQMSCFLK